MTTPTDDALVAALRDAARQAFTAVRADHPGELFYYFALVTTGDGLRPGPSASSNEGLQATLETYRASGDELEPADLRWSEADSPYNLYGDEAFGEVDTLFLQRPDPHSLPEDESDAEIASRFAAMEQALRDLDAEGLFGTGPARLHVLINVVAPGDEDEASMLARARRLNPPESLEHFIADLFEEAPT